MELSQRWYRSADGGIVAGVCSGLAEKFGLAPWVLRFLWTLAIILSLGTAFLPYFIFAICLPRKDRLNIKDEPMVLGVCHRLSMQTQMPPEILRVVTCLLVLCSLGATLIVYFILYFFLPMNKST